MAVTDTPPETVAASGAVAPAPVRTVPGGLAGVLGSGDHKVVGRLYIAFSVVFSLGVAVSGVLVDLERVQPRTLSILSVDTVFQWTSFHDIADPFLLVAPLLLGIAILVVPLQVGSSSIAFPRAAAASFWGWLVGGGLLVASYAMNGGPGGGKAEGVDLFTVALGLVVIALLLGAICVATTVLALRAPGLTLNRVPMFAWSALVMSVMWLVSLPVLLGTLILVYVDHRHASVSYGQNASIGSHIAWATSHPQVYLLAVPVLGFAADAIATATKARIQFRGVVLAAIAAFGFFGFGAYLQSTNPTVLRDPLYIGLSFLAVLPVLALLAVIADLFRRGSAKVTSPVLFSIVALLVLLIAVAGGAVNSIHAIKAGPAADLGITHAAVYAGLIGALGALHHWATKILRRPLSEPLGLLAPLLLLLGAAAFVVPDMISGWTGKGAAKTVGTVGLNTVMVIGFCIALVGVLLALLNVLGGLRTADDVPADPWGGQTLEWATASPPALGNFATPPVVGSPEPLLDRTEETS